MKGKTMFEDFFKRRKDLREEKKYGLTEDKKYGLTDETIEAEGHILYRIKALKDFGDVKKGDLGGFIEKEGGDFFKEGNLSQEGDCWVYDDAKVYGKAFVWEDAKIKDSAEVYGEALVCGEAEVSGEALVYGNAFVSENAKIYDNAWVSGTSMVFGKAEIYKDAEVRDKVVCDTEITEKVSKDKSSLLEKFQKKKQERINRRKNKGIELD